MNESSFILFGAGLGFRLMFLPISINKMPACRYSLGAASALHTQHVGCEVRVTLRYPGLQLGPHIKCTFVYVDLRTPISSHGLHTWWWSTHYYHVMTKMVMEKMKLVVVPTKLIDAFDMFSFAERDLQVKLASRLPPLRRLCGDCCTVHASISS